MLHKFWYPWSRRVDGGRIHQGEVELPTIALDARRHPPSWRLDCWRRRDPIRGSVKGIRKDLLKVRANTG